MIHWKMTRKTAAALAVSLALGAWGIFAAPGDGLAKEPAPEDLKPAHLENQGREDIQRYLPGERQVEEAIADAYSGSPWPVMWDEALFHAALNLSEAVLSLPEGEGLSAIDGRAIQQAVYGAGGWDPTPAAIVLRGGSLESLPQALSESPSLRGRNIRRFGVAVVTLLEGNVRKNAGVVLLATRKAELTDFPRSLKAGEAGTIAGHLAPGLSAPSLAITAPDGHVSHVKIADAELTEKKGGELAFETTALIEQPGVSVVELLAQSDYGPKVVAMFPVSVEAEGKGSGRAGEMSDREMAALAVQELPTGTEGMVPIAGVEKSEEALGQVFLSLNRLREMSGLSALVRDRRLDKVALAHGEDMAAHKFFGHRSPTTGTVGDRLEAAKVPFAAGAENLGEADSALAAHRLIEASPGHRSNLLHERLTHVGLAQVPSPIHPGNVYLVEVFIQEPPEQPQQRGMEETSAQSPEVPAQSDEN